MSALTEADIKDRDLRLAYLEYAEYFRLSTLGLTPMIFQEWVRASEADLAARLAAAKELNTWKWGLGAVN